MDYGRVQDKTRENRHLQHHSTHNNAAHSLHANSIAMENIQLVNDNINHEEKMKNKYKQKLSEEVNRKPGERRMSPIEYFRAQCLSRGVNGIRGIGRLFRIMDDDGNKMLNFNELKTGLKDYSIELKDAQVQEIFDQIDLDQEGLISFNEFLKALRPPMSPARFRVIESCFNKMNINNDKAITIEDIKGTYDVSHHPKYKNGEWTKAQCLRVFLNQFEPDKLKDGKVTYDEFVNYYCGVSASIDDDAYFDLMMRNAFKLTD